MEFRFGLHNEIQIPRPWGPRTEYEAFKHTVEQAVRASRTIRQRRHIGERLSTPCEAFHQFSRYHSKLFEYRFDFRQRPFTNVTQHAGTCELCQVQKPSRG